MSAKFNIRDNGNVVVIDIHGKLASLDGRHSLHSQLRHLAGAGQVRILLNLSGLSSMDSADIGELLAGYAAVTMAGGEVKLLNPSTLVGDVLRTTRLTKLLDIHFSEAAAIRSFTWTPQPLPHLATSLETRSEWYIG